MQEIHSLDLYGIVLAKLSSAYPAETKTHQQLLNMLLKESLCYPASGGKNRLRYYLMIYELYKKILTVPGHIVEIGVWRGYTTILFAQIIQLFGEVDRHRHIYGFDTFDGYIQTDLQNEADPANPVLAKCYNQTSLEFVAKMVATHGAGGFVHLIKGDIAKTLPTFLAQHKDFKISLLFNDCNLYAPTKTALQLLLPCMQGGGIVYLDSYNNPRQLGETRAADEILAQYKLSLQKDLPPLSQPAYCIIPAGGVNQPKPKKNIRN